MHILRRFEALHIWYGTTDLHRSHWWVVPFLLRIAVFRNPALEFRRSNDHPICTISFFSPLRWSLHIETASGHRSHLRRFFIQRVSFCPLKEGEFYFRSGIYIRGYVPMFRWQDHERALTMIYIQAIFACARNNILLTLNLIMKIYYNNGTWASRPLESTWGLFNNLIRPMEKESIKYRHYSTYFGGQFCKKRVHVMMSSRETSHYNRS